MVITPLSIDRPHFGATVTDVDVVAVEREEITKLTDAINSFAVLVFPDQTINDKQQYLFSENFGSLEKATGDLNQSSDRRLSLDINDISNLDRAGTVRERDDRARLFGLANMLWHSDSSFKPTAAKYSLLSARVVPEIGGNTEFADMRAAWAGLDPDIQSECQDYLCLHSQIYSRGQLGFEDFTHEERTKWSPVKHPLVRTHPDTLERSLFLSSHIGAIEGLPNPEAKMFIRDLTEHATQPDYVFAHTWNPGDLVMWDNRSTMHRARRYDHTQARDLHRTTVAGEPG